MGSNFFQHYNSAKDIFNIEDKDYKKIKRDVIKLLRIKYSLEIISEDPLDFKKSSIRFNSNTLFYCHFPKNSRKIYNCVNLGELSVLKFIIFSGDYPPGRGLFVCYYFL